MGDRLPQTLVFSPERLVFHHFAAILLTQPKASGRDAGVVDRDGLENRCTSNCTQGSNPCLSASFNNKQAQDSTVQYRLGLRLVRKTHAPSRQNNIIRLASPPLSHSSASSSAMAASSVCDDALSPVRPTRNAIFTTPSFSLRTICSVFSSTSLY